MNPSVEESLARLAAVANQSLSDYKDAVCDELCALTQSSLAYIAAMNLTEDVLTMIGWSRSAMASCAMGKRPLVYRLEDTGLWGDAVRERKPVITNDYAGLTKPTKKGYPAGHVQVMSHMNLPIFENGKIVLVVGVGNKQGKYTLEDARKAEELMNEVWMTFRETLWESTW